MILKGIVKEDLTNYKYPSMLLMFPNCSFKCGKKNCQNYELSLCPNQHFDVHQLIDLYRENNITKAVVLSGLEPIDSLQGMIDFINLFRNEFQDDIVIYTGYEENEITGILDILSKYPNIVMKFGRFIPRTPHRFDQILGVELASDNQYGKRIS